MRISRENLIPLLACPTCKTVLGSNGTSLVCCNPECRRFERACSKADGKDVLVDFENSILSEKEVLGSRAASPVERSTVTGIRNTFRRALLGDNRISSENELKLITLLRRVEWQPICLVIGGGTIGSGMAELYSSTDVSVIAFDVYQSPHVDFLADVHNIPLESESVDSVWIQAVLEHVLSPEQAVREIWRILKPGGIVYAETPFMQQVHEKAYDFTRFTHSGHRWLFRNFEEIDSGAVGGVGTQNLWNIEHFMRCAFRSAAIGKLAKLSFFWLRFLDALMSKEATLDAAPGFYFLGRKVDYSLAPNEMVAFYLKSRRRDK